MLWWSYQRSSARWISRSPSRFHLHSANFLRFQGPIAGLPKNFDSQTKQTRFLARGVTIGPTSCTYLSYGSVKPKGFNPLTLHCSEVTSEWYTNLRSSALTSN